MSTPLPLWLIGAGVLLLLAAVKVLIQQRRTIEVVPYSNAQLELPKKWDDGEITKLLHRHHNQPAVLSYAVASIKERMVFNQDIKTARRRLQLLASVIEVFKLNREMQGILQDIHLAEKEFEIRQIEASIRLEDASARQESERSLRKLRAQRDELQLQKEISQIRHDTNSLHQSSKSEPAPVSPEQQRSQRHAASEGRIQKLKALKQDVLKLDDEDERIQKVNAIDDEIQREMEEWRKTL